MSNLTKINSNLASMQNIERVQNQLAALSQSALELEKQRQFSRRPDGQIIGTGKADFTQDNTIYTLSHKGKEFQLIDVPGIEGDESIYEEIVRKAVAKAHLVFYVNGTNKKPETGTAEKIRAYLHRGTQVCTLVNVRGNADSYEFEEDRESLESYNAASTAMKQTVNVLETILSPDVMIPGCCVQGLLGFSALAFHPEFGHTSIHPSRDQDLVIQQRNYLKHFSTPKAMQEFSQIDQVANVLDKKLATFKEDIVESNKTKVKELLTEYINQLEHAMVEHQYFLAKLEPDFKKCRNTINEALKSFNRLVQTGRRNLWNDFFSELCDEADDIVEKHFGDNDYITREIKNSFNKKQDALTKKLSGNLQDHHKTLVETSQESMKRLVADIQRNEFQKLIMLDPTSAELLSPADVDLGFELKDFGKMIFNIGSYAASGAIIGSPIPGVGTLIGAVIGAAVGVLVSLLSVFTSKAKRIRKAQGKIRDSIDEVSDKVRAKLKQDVLDVVTPIKKEIETTLLAQIEQLHTNLSEPIRIIQQQIAHMTETKQKLEKMPYGTIQPL